MRVTPALRQELERLFEVVPARSRTDELCVVCPQPGCGDQSGNRSINLQTGKTFCFRCNQGGNVIAWAKRIGITIHADADGPGFFDPQTLEVDLKGGSKSALPAVKAVALPKGFIRLDEQPKSVYVKFIRQMAERKNLRLDDFVEVGAGFTKIDPLWEPYCIFPVVEHGLVVYYQGRTYTDEPDKPTKRFPNRGVLEHGAKYWLYNIDELRGRKAKVAIVVESILNVLSLRWKLNELGLLGEYVPVAAFKHRVSHEQWLKLAKSDHLREVCLLFDCDATALSWSDCERFTGRFRLSIAEMPPGPGGKKNDPNDDVETAIVALENRQPFKSISVLSTRLNAHDASTPWATKKEAFSAQQIGGTQALVETEATRKARMREEFRRRFGSKRR